MSRVASKLLAHQTVIKMTKLTYSLRHIDVILALTRISLVRIGPCLVCRDSSSFFLV